MKDPVDSGFYDHFSLKTSQDIHRSVPLVSHLRHIFHESLNLRTVNPFLTAHARIVLKYPPEVRGIRITESNRSCRCTVQCTLIPSGFLPECGGGGGGKGGEKDGVTVFLVIS